MKQMMKREKAIRDFKTKFTFTRASESDDAEKVIEGYFALYEQETELFAGVYEIITKGAFDNSMNNDIRALWNHNTQYVLGRSKNGSLKLQADEKGLFGTIRLPNTQYANDLFELVQRGDIDQASFGFNINDEELKNLQVVDIDGGSKILTCMKFLLSPFLHMKIHPFKHAANKLNSLNKESCKQKKKN